jgi:hypothetical protein
MKYCGWLLILALILTLAATAALAADPFELAASLPRQFAGVYRWNDRKIDQNVSVRLETVSVRSGKVLALGKGRHKEEYYSTDVTVEMAIDSETLAVQMWERSPSGADGNPKFVVEGCYAGEISGDLSSINAVWTTAGTGRKGSLRLKAN